MDHLNNADVSISIACSVLAQNGEHEAAAVLRGLEIFSASGLNMALAAIKGIQTGNEESKEALLSAELAVNAALKAFGMRPSAAA